MSWFRAHTTELFIWIICFAALFGPAFALFSEYAYDLSANPDVKTYLQIAHFDFDESPVRRYRIIIPALAAGLDLLIGPVIKHIEPWSFPGPNFSLGFSFLLVNCSTLALAGLCIFKLLRSYNISILNTCLALLVFLTCRWTSYFAGLPLVDSLYFLVICMMMLAMRTGNKRLLILCLFLGPWAKESFFLYFPLLLFFCPLQLWQLILYTLLGSLPYFLFRLWVDMHLGTQSTASIEADLQHFSYILPGLKRMFSFHGLYELWSIMGIWSAALCAFLFAKARKHLRDIELFNWVFLLIVAAHALLSNELARMYYLALPILCQLFARALGFINGYMAKNYRS